MGVGRRDDNSLGALRLHACGGERISTRRDVEGERQAAALTLTARRFAAIVLACRGAVQRASVVGGGGAGRGGARGRDGARYREWHSLMGDADLQSYGQLEGQEREHNAS
jgi:hypothetical protein